MAMPQQLGVPREMLEKQEALDAQRSQAVYGDGQTMPTDDAASLQPPAEGSYDASQEQQQSGPNMEQMDKLKRWADPIACKNIAEELHDDVLGKIGQEVLLGYQIDVASRKDWLEANEKWINLAMQVAEKKTTPWVGAANVIYPMLTVSAIQFNARAYPAIVQGANVVKGATYGSDTGTLKPEEQLQQIQQQIAEKLQQMPPETPPEQQQQAQQMAQKAFEEAKWAVPPGTKRARAQRIGDHMSWQLVKQQTEWEEDTDKLLMILPIAGCCFRKSLFAPHLGRNLSVLVNAKKLVVNYWAKDIETAPRITEETEYYPNKVEELIRDGQMLDLDYQALAGATSNDPQAPIEFLEQHCLYDLDGDGYAEPYIVTVLKNGGRVARIQAAYELDGIFLNEETHEVALIKKEVYYTKYEFMPSPEGSFYGVGLGRLLFPINSAVNTIINQLIDAGTLQNTGGGFIGRGFSTQSGSIRLKLGEWRYINTPGSSIKDAIVPMKWAEPSQTLLALLGLLTEAGKEIAAVKDVLTGGDAGSAQMQPTTLLALIEQGLKVFTAIFKRVHRSLQHEYSLLYRLNQIFLDEQDQYQMGEEWHSISREDYVVGAGVTPISDPTMVTDMQRMAQASFMQGYQNDPLMDPRKTREFIFDAARIPHADDFFAKELPQNPDVVEKTARLALDTEELELKKTDQVLEARRIEATVLKDVTAAILNIAKADAEAGDQNIQWASHQLEVVRTMIEGYTNQQGVAPAGAPAGGAAAGGGGGEEPPVEGAQQAPDGKWYVPDPNRPGKYLQVADAEAAEA